MASLEFTERMSGQFVRIMDGQNKVLPVQPEDFEKLLFSSAKEDLEFTLTIQIADVDRFIEDPQTLANAVGVIQAKQSFGKQEVSNGLFNLFVRPEVSKGNSVCKEMHYNLQFHDKAAQPLTFFGYKRIEKEDALDAWKETTTLYFMVWKGHGPKENLTSELLYGVGILHIAVDDFLNQLTTFKVSDHANFLLSETFLKFIGFFGKNLWEAYAPFFFNTTTERWNDHRYPVQTTMGVLQGTKEMFMLDTKDNLTISLQRFHAKPESKSKKVILLVHGLTLSTDMFIMPEIGNLVNHLHQNGYVDVWSLDWRGSGRFVYNLAPHRYTIDDVAKFDLPAAIEFIRTQLGADVEISIISHCVGSMAVMSSVAAGYIQGIKSIVANSVSLNPRSRVIALLKLLVGPFLFESIFGYPYLSPKMPYMPGFRFGKWIYWVSRIFRWECREPACHMLSVMWGWGFPVAYKHENLSSVTHRRLYDLFGGTSFHYYRHIRKMILRRRSVSYDTHPEEIDYFELMKTRNNIPILLTSGSENLIFPNSNQETFRRLKEHLPLLKYEEIPGYGHQDVFMGKNSHLDYFPKIIRFLKDAHAN